MKKLLYTIFVFISLNAWAAINPMHVAPERFTPGKDLELKLEILQGSENLSRATLQYRQVQQESWRNSIMLEDEPGVYLGQIPRDALNASQIQYRFEFETLDGGIEYFPDDKTRTPYFSLDSHSSFSAQSPAFIRLNDETRISTDDDYLLVVSFLEIVDDLDPRSLKVFVGDKDVTNKAQVSGGTLLYRETKPKPGIIKAVVSAKIKGKELYSETWITEVTAGGGKPHTPFVYSGSLNLAANAYSSSNKDISFGNHLSDFATWSDLYGSYGFLQLSSNLYFSSLEESNNQPVNRHNIALKTPYLEVIAGDYSPTLSDYTLNGKNIRGVYSKLDAKYLRLFWVHGQSVRKTTVAPDSLGRFPGGSTFKQEAIGAKLSIGEENGFSFNLIASRHRDIKSSLEEKYYKETVAPGDTLYIAKAQDAAVVAVDLRINAPEQDVLMGVEVAGSLLNKNTLPGAFDKADLDEYGVDLPISPSQVADIFVINSNIEPFGLSASNLAWKVYLRSFMLNNMINVDYQQVGNCFHSLGSFSPMQDATILSISDHFNLGRYLMLSGAYSLTKDNLMGFNEINNRYQSIQAQAIIRIPKMPYLKAAMNVDCAQNKKNPEMDTEGFEPYKADRNMLNIGMGYNIVQIPYVPTQLDISYRFGDDTRKLIKDAPQEDEMQTDNKHNGMNISMINRFKLLPLKTYLSFSANNTDINNLRDSSHKKKKNNRFYGKAEYSLFGDILKPYLSFSNNALSGDQDKQNSNTLALGLAAYPIKNMNVTADYAVQSFKNKSTSGLNYDNSTFRLVLSQRF